MAEEKAKPYQYQEYPKSLYAGGERTGAQRVVNDAEEEVAARAEGFKMLDKELDAKAAERLAPKPEQKKK